MLTGYAARRPKAAAAQLPDQADVALRAALRA